MEIHKGREAASSVDVYLVVRREPLSAKPIVWQWLARLVYFAIGWASDYSVEYQGVFTDEAEARHLAAQDGWSYTKVPLNGCLPSETCQYGTHDFPLSEASAEYRNRRLSFVAVHRERLDEKVEHLKSLEDRINDLSDCIEGKCVKAI